ncbi:MAG: hypothetical protein M1825_004438 [Sarcosagium campestre]|nr:MAG: hypothetical protein M1825_004438 [Sarcosagium campestre]
MASPAEGQNAANEQSNSDFSHGISIKVPPMSGTEPRPPLDRRKSNDAYKAPTSHHRRNRSAPRQVKACLSDTLSALETLNAQSQYSNSDDDGQAMHRINQYVVKQELGRGSFGAVHLAVDQHGTEYAMKEFSKSRLRKRAQSNILRRPHGSRSPGHLAAGVGLNSPLHRHSAMDAHDQQLGGNPLFLIQEEIAIMKKLHHENLVSLIEVLDDPSEDSLYMVMELCKKGVIMKVGIGETAEAYNEEQCRKFFRDLILGIEYLHGQGIVHRDIKPDNLLLTNNNTLKIVDFGVSEMFEKASEMRIAKSAGSPAFLSPELCIIRNGSISGKAADIWSIGVSLYCLQFGRIPFEKEGMLELYDAIKNDDVEFEPNTNPLFVDLEHPWVTKNGQDLLISAEENTSDLVEPPTEEEMNSAITGNFRQLLTVMKAVKKFRSMAHQRKRAEAIESLLGQHLGFSEPPQLIEKNRVQDSPDNPDNQITASSSTGEQKSSQSRHGDGRKRDIYRGLTQKMKSAVSSSGRSLKETSEAAETKKDHHSGGKDSSPRATDGAVLLEGQHLRGQNATRKFGKGQAHDPAEDDPMVLDVGPGYPYTGTEHVVSESPSATDVNIYEKAYQDELERIRNAQGHKTTVYLTRRVEQAKTKLEDKNLLQNDENDRPKIGWGKILEMTKEKAGHEG